MNEIVRDALKVFIIFTLCTCLFYFGLKVMHSEYEQIHRYDSPEGPAVKVFHSQIRIMERFQLFFQEGD